MQPHESKSEMLMCLPQVHFGAPFPHSFAAVLQEKARKPSLIRAIAMEGRRFTSKELFEQGMVDQLAEGGTPGVIAKATKLAESISQNASTGVWGLIKARHSWKGNNMDWG